MQFYARTNNGPGVAGVVVEIWPHDVDAPMLGADDKPLAEQPTPVEVFGPDFGALFITCSADVQQGWTYDGTSFSAPVPVVAPPPTLADLAIYANLKQWSLATGGFTLTLSGQVRTFSTSEISMTLMNGKFLRLTQPNAPATISWQFATGFEDVSAADFAKAAIAISDFVQATFDALKPVLAAIVAGTTTTTAQIDAAAWPSATASS